MGSSPLSGAPGDPLAFERGLETLVEMPAQPILSEPHAVVGLNFERDLLYATQRLNQQVELGPTADVIAELANRWVGAPIAIIFSLGANGEVLLYPERGCLGLSPLEAESRRADIAACWVSLNSRPNFDAVSINLPLPSPGQTSDHSAQRGQAAVASHAGMPLWVGDRCFGFLYVSYPEPHSWTARQLETLQAVACLAASAIARGVATAELQNLNRARDDYLSVASHELRTPLTAIKGFASILATDGSSLTSESAYQYAHIIDAEADRMIRLVDDILNVSRIDSGLMVLERRPVVVSEAVELAVSAAWGPDSAKCERRLEPRLAVFADLDRLVCVLVNLLENAKKYANENARITITARHRVASVADEVEIRVWNEGQNFTAGEMALLFKKFSRLDRTRTVARGAGLGLYIARQLIAAMAGRVWIEATAGGPTFAIALPGADVVTAMV